MRISAISHVLPSARVTNADLVRQVIERNEGRLPADACETLGARLCQFLVASGAETRYHRVVGEKALDHGVAAATLALAEAGLAPRDINVLIFVGVGRGFLEPATANVFQASLGLERASCFDVLDACASWLRGVDIANHYLRCGTAKHVLIINCEFNFGEYITWEFDAPDDLDVLSTRFTIGEAATATIVSQDSGGAEYYTRFCSAGAFSDLCGIPLPNAEQFASPGARNGRAPLQFYSHSKRLNSVGINQLTQQFLADERITSFDYDIIFGHSVSVPSSLRVANKLSLDIGKHYEIFPRYGNTVSASLPLAMSLAIDEGRLNRGDRVLLLMASAGVTTGYGALIY